MLAFGPLAAQPPLASASRCGMLLFVLALARLCRRPGGRGKFKRVAQPFIPADRLRRPLNSHVMPHEMTPSDKFDVKTAQAISASGNPPEAVLLEWIQDLNWPVAHILAPFLASSGAAIAPGIREVLCANDETWKYSVLIGVVAESAELKVILRSDLERIRDTPTRGEEAEGLPSLAIEILGAAS